MLLELLLEPFFLARFVPSFFLSFHIVVCVHMFVFLFDELNVQFYRYNEHKDVKQEQHNKKNVYIDDKHDSL